jgi:SNF2 family DNA or RNA helicase
VSAPVHAERVGNSIELSATYADKEFAKAIPGSRFHTPPPLWTVPLSWAACMQLRGSFGDRLTIGPELREWAKLEKENRAGPAAALRDEIRGGPIPVDPPRGRELRPFQQSDVRWMLAAGSGLLMNPVGSGKTVSVLTWMRCSAVERALVVCPASMRPVWAKEAALWYPELPAYAIEGTARERRELIEEVMDYGGLAIMSFEAMRHHSRLAPYGQVALSVKEKQPKELNMVPWDAVIVDEAHRLKDPKSKQTRAIWAVAQGANVRHRWALTATPQTKGLDTLWPILHFADPNEWPSRTKFVDRYCMVQTNFWGGITVGALRPEMEPEFMSIFDPRSRRLPKEIVLPQLPPVVPILRELEMTPEQAGAYKQMAEMSLAQVQETDVVVATSTAAQYVRLGQFASSFARVEARQVRDRETGEVVLKDFVELVEPSNKIDAFTGDLEDWLAQGEAVAAFATSRRLINLLSDVLRRKKIEHSLIVGGQKDVDRMEQIERFQRGEVDVILVVIAAGGSGITLTRARIGAVLQRSWSKVDDTQMEGRWNRIGSEVHASTLRVDYVSVGTVDVGQLDVLEGKEEMAQRVLRDKETIERMLRGEHIEETA